MTQRPQEDADQGENQHPAPQPEGQQEVGGDTPRSPGPDQDVEEHPGTHGRESDAEDDGHS